MSILDIGLECKFEDEVAEITGKVVFADEDGTEWIQWYLSSEDSDGFWIREYEDDDELCYEILSSVEADENYYDGEEDEDEDEDNQENINFTGDKEEELAYQIFNDWKSFKHLAMRSGVKVKSIEGKQPVKEFSKGEAVKIVDVSFMDDEDLDAFELEEDEVIVDTSIMWSENNTWVFGIEYAAEDDIKKMFSI